MHTLPAFLFATLSLTAAPVLAFFPGQPNQPCDNAPPVWARKPPTVQMRIYDTANADILEFGGKDRTLPRVLYGLTYPMIPGKHLRADGVLDLADPAVKAAKVWVIYLNEDMTPKERACTLLYEQAHLPPNNWADYAVERHVAKWPRGKR